MGGDGREHAGVVEMTVFQIEEVGGKPFHVYVAGGSQ